MRVREVSGGPGGPTPGPGAAWSGPRLPMVWRLCEPPCAAPGLSVSHFMYKHFV